MPKLDLKYNHSEAFALMKYYCENCRGSEIIWNSRDGVTPFIIECKFCKSNAQHVSWKKDVCNLYYRLKSGQRYFRNLTKDEALGIAIARLKQFEKTEYKPPPQGSKEREELLQTLTNDLYDNGNNPTIDMAS